MDSLVGVQKLMSPSCSLCRLPLRNAFCSRSTTARDALISVMRPIRKAQGVTLYGEGEPSLGVHFLCQGRAKLLTANAQGRTLIVRIVQPGEVLGVDSTVTGRPHALTVQTLEPTLLNFVERDDFLHFLREFPDACLHATEHLGHECRSGYEWIRLFGLPQSISEKMARLLLEWSRYGPSDTRAMRIDMPYTHEDMSQLIGVSRESVTRTLLDFRKRRILEIDGSVLRIIDKAALEAVASAQADPRG